MLVHNMVSDHEYNYIVCSMQPFTTSTLHPCTDHLIDSHPMFLVVVFFFVIFLSFDACQIVSSLIYYIIQAHIINSMWSLPLYLSVIQATCLYNTQTLQHISLIFP